MESDHGGRDGGRAAKPCRACPLSNPDFKSFMKTGPANPEKAKKPSKMPKVPPKPCPPDVDEIGRGSWTLLHTMSAYLPEGAVHKQRCLKGANGQLITEVYFWVFTSIKKPTGIKALYYVKLV